MLQEDESTRWDGPIFSSWRDMWEMTRGEGARDRKQESSPARLTIYAVLAQTGLQVCVALNFWISVKDMSHPTLVLRAWSQKT